MELLWQKTMRRYDREAGMKRRSVEELGLVSYGKEGDGGRLELVVHKFRESGTSVKG